MEIGGTMTITDAPGIYSTGTITVTGAAVSVTGSEGAVREGENPINLTNSSLSCSVKLGEKVYQSMSGDAMGAVGTFTLTGGSLSSAAGPPFYFSNISGTSFRIQIPAGSLATLKIYDVLEKQLATIFDVYKPAGISFNNPCIQLSSNATAQIK